MVQWVKAAVLSLMIPGTQRVEEKRNICQLFNGGYMHAMKVSLCVWTHTKKMQLRKPEKLA